MKIKGIFERISDLIKRPPMGPLGKDGLPVPPPELINLVAGTDDLDWFWKSGELGADSMLEILKKNGLAMEDFNSVLDFGCGIGRVLRHFKNISGLKFYGTDYNPELIQWCQNNLKFATFNTNKLVGKLKYRDQQFDFIYALSVFTHMREEQQLFWIKELRRVLRPGGFLFITTHGSQHYYKNMSPEDLERFHNGEMIVYSGNVAGTNTCTAFHPETYVRNVLAKDLLVIDYILEGAKGNPLQDVYLIKKPD